MKKILSLLIIMIVLSSCKKENNDFKIGDIVYLNDINLNSSPIPLNCCICPCIITNKYTDGSAGYFYDIRDQVDSTATHLYQNQLKP